ncbi:hypothetical protein [Oceanobacillus kimchii]|uniref:hypothetical protein n=1 Tax=Oceanobacillus kimchii TaxID=746691 RepID=UPI003B02D991
MKKISLWTFLKHYLGLAFVMLLLYLVIEPSNSTSLPLVLLLGLPITAIMLFTGLDQKLKKHLP